MSENHLKSLILKHLKISTKMVNLAILKNYGQIVLPDRTILKGQKLDWKIWMRHFEWFSNNVFRSNFCLWNNRLVHELPFKKRKVEFYCLKLWVIIIGHSCNFGGMSITLYGSPWSRAASESFGPITATHRKHLKIEKKAANGNSVIKPASSGFYSSTIFFKTCYFSMREWETQKFAHFKRP